MNLGDHCLCPAISVSIDRKDLLIPIKKNVIDTPCIDRKAFNFGILLKCLLDTSKNVIKKCLYIPNKVPVFPSYTVWKTKDLSGLNFSTVAPSDYMSAARCADVNCQIILHSLLLPYA